MGILSKNEKKIAIKHSLRLTARSAVENLSQEGDKGRKSIRITP